jgi:hypothetical protein
VERRIVVAIYPACEPQLVNEGRDTAGKALHRTQDIETDDIAGAFPNPIERRLAIKPRHQMVFDEAVAAVAFERFCDGGNHALAIPVFGDRRTDAAEEPLRFACAFAIKRGNKTKGEPRRGLRLEREIGDDIGHDRLINERALKGAAVRDVMRRLRYRLPHQSRRSNGEIEPRVMVHLKPGADAVPRLADEMRDRAAKFDL